MRLCAFRRRCADAPRSEKRAVTPLGMLGGFGTAMGPTIFATEGRDGARALFPMSGGFATVLGTTASGNAERAATRTARGEAKEGAV
ncbi:hypothetical protein DFH09DRAFT_1176004 [Mycena vulgaris]|nr:hypothetical protein DFH09DRAFT_1176004 [Mycena vulgaris]